MRRHPVRLAALLALGALAALACGPKRAPGLEEASEGGAAGALTGVEGGVGAAATGGAAGTTEGREGPGGAGAGGAAGAGTGGAPWPIEAVCGNGEAEPGEHCDGDDFGAWTCAAAGFEVGELACGEDCRLDVSGCTGVERCTDGRDNDGDQTVDCGDDDCAEACADPCAEPVEIADPSDVNGVTDDHAAIDGAAERWGSEASGPAVAYRVTAAHTGILIAGLVSGADLGVSVRTDCADAASELRRGYQTAVEVPVTEGDVLYVFVDGLYPDAEGSYLLSVRSHAIVCGDHYRDGEEACDDGNTRDGDGCSAECTVESTEGPNNDTLADADPLTVPYYAAIDSGSDEDWVEVEVANPKTSLIARTFDFGDGACALNELDSVLELYDASEALVARDDDSGAGYCADLRVPNLPIGTYYVRVLASPTGATGSFPYRLYLELDVCGNGRVSDAEECDDGNEDAGDGCAPDCTYE